MNINKSQPLLVGLSVASGATALIIALTSVGPASSQAPLGASAGASDPGTPVATATPSSSVPVPTPPQAPVSLDQARAMAERVAGGRADKVEAEVGGVYDISVLRANGTEVQLVIDGRTGRVVSNVAELPDSKDQSEVGPADSTEPTNGADATDSTEQPGD